MTKGITLPKTVLVVDDDPDIRNIVSGSMEAQGYTVISAGDAAEALKLTEGKTPDLAILDVMMPGMTGDELCLELKKLQGSHLPVLMLTARDGIDAKVQSLEGGADDYLTKPFDWKELNARVHALLRVRELNLKLIEKERELVVYQLAGSAAHKLGQPLSAILLNCHLLEALKPEDPRYQQAVQSIKQDSHRMADLIEKL